MQVAALAWLLPAVFVFSANDGQVHPPTPAPAAKTDYISPYQIVLTTPRAELIADFARAPRNDPHAESELEFVRWYDADARRRLGAWGPRPRFYPPPEDIDKRSLLWRRERVIAAAEKFIGYGYQHHHLPDWDPPEDWPWKSTCAGKNGLGVDCSNLTTFVYDYALGLRFTSETEEQSRLRTVPGPRIASGAPQPNEIDVERIERGDSYHDFIAHLEPADLVFVKNDQGQVSHVVIWLGALGRSPDGTALVIDSHGDSTKDARGETIPCGVRIRPFREDGWYWRSASHALRIVHAPTVAAGGHEPPKPKR